MSDLFNLNGKVAVVIGGNSVLGSAIAKGLADHGAKLAIVGRNMEKAEVVVNDIVAAGGEAKAFQANVSERESLIRIAEEVQDWADGWDILLNAPGKNSSTPFLELEMEEYDDIMDVNLKGIVQACQVFAKQNITQYIFRIESGA